mgnify:CR=1 FL=1
MESKIIMVNLDADIPEGFAVQYDYGQILRIQGGNLPKAVEVHFSLDETGGESITRIGTTKDGVTEAPVPDSMLENNDCEQNYSFYAYVYVRDETSGNTEHKITIHVKARSKPEIPGDVEAPELFGEVMKNVNEAAERAEQAEEKAKTSAEEAGNYAKSASESAAMAEQTKEAALEEIGYKQQEVLSSIQKQEETSIGEITIHTDNEIQRIREESSESEKALRQTINDASTKNEKLRESNQTADTTKTELDKSTELAGDAKTELDTSIGNAGTEKTALDTSISGATEQKQALDTTLEQAGEVNTSLGEQIGNAEQILESVAQIETNKEDIRTLKDGLSKNVLNDTKTKRNLEALWKLNQGISYQFEMDDNKAYQKDIPSGAKLASVKKIGGRTVVWNQLATNIISNWNFESVNSVNLKEEDGCMSATINVGSAHILWERYNPNRFVPMVGHKYYVTIGVLVPKKAYVYYEALGTKLSAETIEANIWTTYSNIISPSIDNNSSRPFDILLSQSGSSVFEPSDKFMFKNIMAIDLTKMFGAGNEPSTSEEFEALFPEDYYPYNEGTLMSIPVNEVVEKGRNLFDCYGFSCTGIYDKNTKRDITNSYGTTISTINPTNSITVTQDKANDSTAKDNYTNGYFCVGVRMKNNKEYVMSFDFIPTKMLIDNPVMRLLVNGDGNSSIGAIDGFSLNVKKHIVVKFTYKPLESRQYIELRNGGMSGIFENFQLEDGATATAYSPYHKNTYPIPQAILDLDGYGDGVSDDVYNYVDWENKEYHKRVGRVDFGSLNWKWDSSWNCFWATNLKNAAQRGGNTILNANYKKSSYFTENQEDKTYTALASQHSRGSAGVKDTAFEDSSKTTDENLAAFEVAMQGVMLYYELAEEEIIDISDIIDSTFQEPIEVESGGTLTFKNSNGDGYRVPVPNEEEYVVSLAEVSE